MKGIDLNSLKQELAARADVLLADLLGKPSSRSGHEWRWGRRGSLSYSPGLGAFYDHEKQAGGSLLDLIAAQRACSFGEAVDFAREWLGGHVHIEPRAVAAAPLYQPDTLAAAKALWAAARPVHGTAAEKYLSSRGIGQWPADRTAMVPSAVFGTIETLGWWTWPALALLLTTEDGKASATQLVALNDNGSAVMRDGRKIKRTIGPMTGAAFRMPSNDPTALLLAEGPETGLTCWQSTGAETWALCGSIARADLSGVTTARPIIICADDDPDGSPSVQTLRDTVERWRIEGRSVHVAYPWPHRRRDKSDFADVLLSDGGEAVRWRILEVMP
jgi:putative DNA primase/helicase